MLIPSIVAFLACASQPDWLVRTDVIEPGGDCAAGGLSVLGGTDVDGDQILEDDEVKSREVVCNGTDGTSGATTLVSTSEEPAGANSAEGGTRVDSGIDDNADGQLSDDEIDVTTYVCDGATPETDVVWYGDVSIQTAEDADQLAGYDVINGSLDIYMEGDLSLPDLRAVSGYTYMYDSDADNDTLLRLSAPSLEQLGYLNVSNSTLDAPELSLVQAVYIEGTVADVEFLSGVSRLQRLELYSATVADTSGFSGPESIQEIALSSNNVTLASLTSFDSLYAYGANMSAPNVTSARYVYMSDIASNLNFLTGITDIETIELYGVTIGDDASFANLRTIDDLSVYYGTMPDVPSLTAVTALTVYDTTATTLDGLSALRSFENLYVYYNSSLSDIEGISGATPADAHFVQFYYNPSLCSYDTEGLLSRMGVTSYYVYYSSDSSSCP
jgi:hypothetical protein